MLSTKNLAKFTKNRPGLKVVGAPNLNSTRGGEGGSLITDRKSYFSKASQSRFSTKSKDPKHANIDRIRVHRSNNAEQHKKRIFDVVNQLTEEELEKVSEMLRVSEALEQTNANPTAVNAEQDDEVQTET